MHEPAFREDEFQKVLEDQKQSLKALKEDIYSYASLHLMKRLYGDHPYGMVQLGNEASLENMTRADAQAFYEQLLAPQRMVVAVFGDIDVEAIKKPIEAIFASIQGSGMESKHAIPALNSTEVQEGLPKEQAVTMLGFHGVSSKDPKRYSFEVIKTVLSGSAGRLYQQIRGDEGLSYVVGAGQVNPLDPGYFVMYAGMKPEEAGRVMELLDQASRSLYENGISDKELKQAQIQIIGRHQSIFESRQLLMQSMVQQELGGLGYEETFHYPEHIRNVNLDSVQEIIREYLSPDKSVRIMISPQFVEGLEIG